MKDELMDAGILVLAFIIVFLVAILLGGCTKHVAPNVSENTHVWKGPITSKDGTYMYWTDGATFVFVSKTGPVKAEKELCPHGVICNTDTIGQMYTLKRAN